MPSCDFSLSHAHDPEYLFGVVEQLVSSRGGVVRGTAREGEIQIQSPAGAIRARYQASGRALRVEIVDKPFVVPCAAIQSELANMLATIPPQVVEVAPPSAAEQAAPRAPDPSTAPDQDWLWDLEQRRTVYRETDFEPLVVTGRRPRRWWPWALAAAVLGAGIWAWRFRRA